MSVTILDSDKVSALLKPLPAEPLVSVIIPAYNAFPFIGEAVQSALAQSYKRLEVIVINDGSTDETDVALRDYGHRITYLEQSNSGPAAARNRGIRSSSGELVAFLDADDLWLPTKIRKQVDFICANQEYGIVTTDVETFSAKQVTNPTLHKWYPIRNGRIVDQLLFHNWIGASAAMVRRECFEHAGMFEETLTPDGKGQCTAEDWLLWMKIAAIYPVYFLDEVMVRHREHQSNYSLVDPDRVFHHLLRNLETIQREIPYFSENPHLVRKAAARICLIRGANDFYHLNLPKARAKFLRGLSYRRTATKLWLFFLASHLPAQWLQAARRIKHKVSSFVVV